MAKKTSKRSAEPAAPTPIARSVSSEERQRLIAEAAYYRALARGFVNGSPEDDWLQAEQEVNQTLLNGSAAAPTETAGAAPAAARVAREREYTRR
jgi:hypothetical protein